MLSRTALRTDAPSDSFIGGRSIGDAAGLSVLVPTLSFHTVIGGNWLSFLSDFHGNLAVVAVIFCQNDSVAPGLLAVWWPTALSIRIGLIAR